MRHLTTFLALAAAAGIPLSPALRAADASGETKLRETLRNTMLQLRSAETERDTLKATQAQNEEEKKAALAQVDALTKQLAAAKQAQETADKAIADQTLKQTQQEAQLTEYKQAIERWKAAQAKAAELLQEKEAARAKLAADAIVLQRKVADRETKNLTLYKTATEILTRYEKFGLGTALAAREPFVGLTRVKLENQVQDYEDKIRSGKVTPGE